MAPVRWSTRKKAVGKSASQKLTGSADDVKKVGCRFPGCCEVTHHLGIIGWTLTVMVVRHGRDVLKRSSCQGLSIGALRC